MRLDSEKEEEDVIHLQPFLSRVHVEVITSLGTLLPEKLFFCFPFPGFFLLNGGEPKQGHGGEKKLNCLLFKSCWPHSRDDEGGRQICAIRRRRG